MTIKNSLADTIGPPMLERKGSLKVATTSSVVARPAINIVTIEDYIK